MSDLEHRFARIEGETEWVSRRTDNHDRRLVALEVEGAALRAWRDGHERAHASAEARYARTPAVIFGVITTITAVVTTLMALYTAGVRP